MKHTLFVPIALSFVTLGSLLGSAAEETVPARAADDDLIARGRYLVEGSGCEDCHTPWIMGPDGPQPDATRAFSGHPEGLEMPPAPELPPGPWVITVSETNTAWAGPWGVSFTANLTPDDETGIGLWNEDTFVATLRAGKHMGMGRPLLPPMPWPAVRKLSDDDLRAMFAFLRTQPPLRNRVPEPIAPRN